MAQPQRSTDVHQDELCPPNKRYALMDANKKIDLDNPLYPTESKIMFSEMVLFFLNTLGFTLELRSPSNFMTTRLVQPWQSLGKIFARCLTTQVTWSHIQTAFADHANVILFCQQYTCRLGHYMTVFPKISRRARDKYHNLEDDAMVKNIFNSGSIKTVLE
ncbi:hypothetical protein Tco_1258903 [Tanacetum coccineum]